MSDIRVSGGAKLRILSLHLRQMGADKKIADNLADRLRRMTGSVVKEIRASALRTLPKRGGLAQWVSESTITTKVKRSGNAAGVYITVGKGEHDIAHMDAGRIRHPLWGNAKHWYWQSVNPGFGTEVRDGPIADEFRTHMGEAVDAAIAEVVRGF